MGGHGRPFFVGALGLPAGVFFSIPQAGADCPEFCPGVQVGTVGHGAINEASGLAASRANDGVLWVHNDSGDSARVFAMSTQGTHLGIYNVIGVGARDWEDMAVGPGPAPGQSYLYLGDIGDNSAARSSVKVYRVPEPAVSSSQTPVVVNLGGAETVTLVYPGGARDAETLIVDPLTRDIYVISKRENPSKVFRAPYPQSTTQPITMQHVANLSWGGATGGDISPDGDEATWRNGDVNLDGTVNLSDIVEMIEHWQDECPGDLVGVGEDAEVVPEPATLSLLALGACLPLLRRRR